MNHVQRQLDEEKKQCSKLIQLQENAVGTYNKIKETLVPWA